MIYSTVFSHKDYELGSVKGLPVVSPLTVGTFEVLLSTVNVCARRGTVRLTLTHLSVNSRGLTDVGNIIVYCVLTDM